VSRGRFGLRALQAAVATTAVGASLTCAVAAFAQPLPEGVGRGVAIALCYEQTVQGSYAGWLWEAANLGADRVLLVVSWGQSDVRATEISPRRDSPRDDDVLRAIRQAHAMGMLVTLFPILTVDVRAPGEWRGRLAPSDVDAWFSSYRRFVLHYADVAARGGVAMYSVGSELGSMERHDEAWRRVIADVRQRYDGALTYSANWDHFHMTPFWGALDAMGVTAYHELADEDGLPTVDAMVAALRPFWDALESLSVGLDKPIVVTEAGYVSRLSAAARPWDHTAAAPVSLQAQADAWRAFMTAAAARPFVDVIHVWNGFGAGGPYDGDYTPRHKPAEREIRRWFERSEAAR